MRGGGTQGTDLNKGEFEYVYKNLSDCYGKQFVRPSRPVRPSP